MKTSILILACLISRPSPLAAGESVDFVRDVRPILAKHCASCHGAARPKGGLRLDTAAAVFKGGDGGPAVVAGNAEESLLIEAVTREDVSTRMPLKRPPLTASQIATLRAWIDQGAVAPAAETPDPTFGLHWAFLPPGRHDPPVVKDPGWCRNPIDRFILAKLEREGVRPSPEAGRATLIRRLSFDLLGLPPSPSEIDDFLADDRPDAYERVVGRLLGSPHHGEMAARRWLDLARYADSNGYSIDAPRSIWKYRDWVIDAFNRDLPFDRFTLDQIAGDLLPDATIDQKVATGFHRNTPINQEGGIDLEQFRVESVVDRVNTTATVFLGLTMGCCQCHDHKFDPISQREYYRLFAFFNNVDEPELSIATPEELARRDEAEAKVAAYLREIVEHDPTLVANGRAWEAGLDMAGRQKQSQAVRAAFDVVGEKRTEDQRMVVFAAFIDQAKEARTHKEAIAAIKRRVPKIVTTMVVRERPDPRETYIQLGGDFTRRGDRVTPGVPSVLPQIQTASAGPNRLDLARWLVDPKNPLTARVVINRIWQADFGRGLVETEDDFGTQGTPPSHPELLDWLAGEFVARGWSMKAMHRLIVTSATYRQASIARPDLDTTDPGNRWLARQSRLRLDAECIRDVALSAGGLLNPKVGGPSVFPPQPDGVMNLGQMRRAWVADEGPDRYRRGMYTFFWRATPHPLLTAFDAPDRVRSCTRRLRSNTPLQALTLLNDAAFFECAKSLAGRILKEAPSGDADRLRFAFRLCLGRPPGPGELRRLEDLLRRERSDVEGDELASWMTVARVLLNLDEFITRE